MRAWLLQQPLLLLFTNQFKPLLQRPTIGFHHRCCRLPLTLALIRITEQRLQGNGQGIRIDKRAASGYPGLWHSSVCYPFANPNGVSLQQTCPNNHARLFGSSPGSFSTRAGCWAVRSLRCHRQPSRCTGSGGHGPSASHGERIPRGFLDWRHHRIARIDSFAHTAQAQAGRTSAAITGRRH